MRMGEIRVLTFIASMAYSTGSLVRVGVGGEEDAYPGTDDLLARRCLHHDLGGGYVIEVGMWSVVDLPYSERVKNMVGEVKVDYNVKL